MMHSFEGRCRALAASRKRLQIGRAHRAGACRCARSSCILPQAKKPLRVYDPSGPITDPAVTSTSKQGLPRTRASWITARGRRRELTTAGRQGRWTTAHRRGSSAPELPLRRAPLARGARRPVTQLPYARADHHPGDGVRRGARHRSEGREGSATQTAKSLGCVHSAYVTPEFVRAEVGAGRHHPRT